MEVERQVRRDIGVRGLFVRQDDVQADALAPGLIRAAVPGLHHAGAAAGDDDILAPVGGKAALGHQSGEATRLVIVVRQVGQRLGAGRGAVFRGGDAGATEHDDGRVDPAFVHDQLRLQQFQLQAHRAQFFARQEIAVGKGQPVCRSPGLGRVGDPLGRGDILDAVAEGMAAGFVFHQGALDCVGVLQAL